VGALFFASPGRFVCLQKNGVSAPLEVDLSSGVVLFFFFFFHEALLFRFPLEIDSVPFGETTTPLDLPPLNLFSFAKFTPHSSHLTRSSSPQFHPSSLSCPSMILAQAEPFFFLSTGFCDQTCFFFGSLDSRKALFPRSY